MLLPILVPMSEWKKLLINWIFIQFLIFPVVVFAQPKNEVSSYSLMFYNVENLFDTVNDSLVQDDEFSQAGLRNWNRYRLKDKLNKIAKIVMTANGFELPSIVGLCEVENRKVLEQLLAQTPLSHSSYRIIHKDSPDERGIDVALLYRSDQLDPIFYQYHALRDEKGELIQTREILEASFQMGDDTLHVFVNHWPSRYRGQAETEADRMLAATLLKGVVSSVFEQEGKAKIAILGDFNDQPDNASICNGLNAVDKDRPQVPCELVNLAAGWKSSGTLKHRQSWQIFDQLIVSDFLLEGDGVFCTPVDAQIVKLPILFEDDPIWGGKRLFRTYRGYQYTGGFSDHLPVILKLHSAN